MAIATMTLDETAAIPGINLFDELPYLDYPYVKREIMENYGQREIAYETPLLFKRKLNFKLRTLCDNYNNMLRSQMFEIDPFVTDYSELLSTTGRESESGSSQKTYTGQDERTDSRLYNDTDSTSTGSTSETGHETGSERTAKALHTASDTQETKETSTELNIGQDTKGSESKHGTEDTGTDETFSRTLTTDKTENLTENTKTDTDRTVTTDVTATDNQTGLKWTEKGSSEGHNLDVHSDTPQLMLFNEPNHYYGTGRAHDYGVVKQDGNGDYYEHYPETEPKDIDAGSYEIGSGDTPWFNYASDADNKTGHDSYEKSGTEEYERGTTSKTGESTDEGVNSDHTAETVTHEDVTEESTKRTDVNRQYSEDKGTAETLARTEKGHTSETGHEVNVTDTTENGSKNTAADTKKEGISTTNSIENGRSYGLDERNLTGRTLSDGRKTERSQMTRNSVRKGRTGRSPADLLKAYRETLTFNADIWLLGELEPLFLQIF